jgi:hypothetical protein
MAHCLIGYAQGQLYLLEKQSLFILRNIRNINVAQRQNRENDENSQVATEFSSIIFT